MKRLMQIFYARNSLRLLSMFLCIPFLLQTFFAQIFHHNFHLSTVTVNFAANCCSFLSNFHVTRRWCVRGCRNGFQHFVREFLLRLVIQIKNNYSFAKMQIIRAAHSRSGAKNFAPWLKQLMQHWMLQKRERRLMWNHNSFTRALWFQISPQHGFSHDKSKGKWREFNCMCTHIHRDDIEIPISQA